jgi:hypothetical protein
MATPSERPRDHLRTLALFLVAGVVLFVGLMAVINLIMLRFLAAPDQSILYFYPVMAGAGALFGFERWWAHEQGPYNPFHE